MVNFFNKTSEENKTSMFTSVIKNVLIMYGLTIIALLIFAFILTYVNVPDGLVTGIVLIISILSIMMSGLLVGKTATSKGWLNGSIAGFFYMALLYIIGSLVYNSYSFSLNFAAMLLMGIFAGAFGGIIGVNTRKR